MVNRMRGLITIISMKQRNKIAVSAVILSVLFIGAGSVVYAQDASTTPVAVAIVSSTTPQVLNVEQKLDVSSTGGVTIRGNVDSIGTNFIMLRSWGGVWKVAVANDTEIIPKVQGSLTDLANFKVGDYVGAQGQVSTSENWTVNAKVVRDWTARTAAEAERKQNAKQAHDLEVAQHEREKALRDTLPKTRVGVVGTLLSGSFTFISGSTTLTVTTDATTQLANRNWNTILFGDIHTGDSVRVYGGLSSSTVTALILRDMAIPR